MSDNAARRQSVARKGLVLARRIQVEAGFAGFLGFRVLAADLRGPAGLIVIGLPAGAEAASCGAGPLNCARHAGESWDFFAAIQAVMRSILGISELHRRKASLVQACSCSGV